jgi:hypothetical protein
MPRTRKDEALVLTDDPRTRHGSRAGAGPVTAELAPRIDTRGLADAFVAYLETGRAAPGLFAPGVFVDFTMPRWRLQAHGVEDALALRQAGHPKPGRVARSRFDPIPTGFVLEVEEVWDDGGEQWYCRELFRADGGPEGITELAVYCTGDWDGARRAEHAREVTLIRA